ncbi:MAG TPA: DUF5916 domain-containing protein [Polyangia bacterium]|nr:DUF5916 domain-containing protein [Polyangia bacterium]
MPLALALPLGSTLAWLFAQTAAAPATGPVAAPTPAVVAPAPASTLGPRPHLAAVRARTPPVIDGRLDDDVWRTAVSSDAFTQHFPNEGAPPSERTTVRVLYDDDALYVGIDCQQTHSRVIKRLMRRDTQAASDGVWLDVDSRRDGVSAFHFSVNAAGVLGDAIHFNDTDYSSDWDAVWEGRAADTPTGYSVELRIPLYVLRFDALPVQDWGFEVRRFIEARQETDDWAFIPRSAASFVPLLGKLEGLSDLRPRRALQLRPFVLGRARHRAADASAGQGTLAHGFDASASAGVDAKAAVTNELTLDLSLNPDFGQVEADAVVLNLSTFETFFPEKRPFFLEGIDTFTTPRQLLYTRRIGHQPATPTLAAGETLVDLPEPSPIYGAAKLVGTIGGRTTVGLLSAFTGGNDVVVRTTPTNPRLGSALDVHRLAEPPSIYNVLRLKRLVGANTDVGVMATSVNRFEPTYAPAPMQLCGATLVLPAHDGRCTNDAYALAADGRWRSRDGDYAVTAQALATALVHGPARAEADGIPVQPGAIAPGGSFNVEKSGGAHWLWNAYQQVSGRQLEYNDVGYLDRKNDYQGTFAVTYRTVEPWWRTIETRSSLQLAERWTLDGVDLTNQVTLSTSIILANFWQLTADVLYKPSTHDDREIGDGTALERASRAGGDLGITSDPRRRVTWALSGQALRLPNGSHYQLQGDFTARALPQLELDFDPLATWDEGEPRYVETTGTRAYLFGRQQARSVGATLRASYTFLPELSLQLYMQPFLARVHYTSFLAGAVDAPRAKLDLASLSPAAAPASTSSPDTLTSTLNVNVVLRWEYRLGSTVFLVYTRAQTPALVPGAAGATSLEIAPITHGRAAIDVIMLKLAYWYG